MKKLLLLTLILLSTLGVIAQKIEDLPRATIPGPADLIIIDQADATRSITVAALLIGPPAPWVGLFPDGTVDFPGITFWNDLDVGVYRPGADILGFSAGGVLAISTREIGGTILTTMTDTTIIEEELLPDADDGANIGADATRFNLGYFDTVFAAVFTNSDFVLGESGSDITVSSDSILITYLASASGSTVLSPTETGGIAALATSDVTEITLDTLDVNYITVNSYINFLNESAGLTYISTSGTQTIGTGGTFERLYEGAMAYTPMHLENFTENNGRLTYTGAITRDFIVTVHAAIEGDETAQLIQIQIAEGGTPIAGSNMQADFVAVNTDKSISTTWIVELAQNEYLEVFGTSDANDDEFTIHNLVMRVNQY